MQRFKLDTTKEIEEFKDRHREEFERQYIARFECDTSREKWIGGSLERLESDAERASRWKNGASPRFKED